MENFSRIVHLIGKSFSNTGIEILLHDLSNPSGSLVALANNVTGRHLEMQLEKNILSRDEYANTLKEKRHFKDGRFQ